MGISSHVLLQPDFWAAFAEEVEIKKSWRCSFPQNVLTEGVRKDSTLYSEDTTFLHRRQGVSALSQNDTVWAATVLGACKELAEGKEKKCALELKRLHVLEALRDYVDHLDYFYKVASIMDTRSGDFVLVDLRVTPIHDIDKLDPIMLVAYSERFQDNKCTSLWFTCVDNHTRKNPHHQAHCLWTDCCVCDNKLSREDIETCDTCDRLRNSVLREMVCDKVSRKLQKELDGEICDQMWDVDINFYKGLPERWLSKAIELMQLMKCQNKKRHT